MVTHSGASSDVPAGSSETCWNWRVGMAAAVGLARQPLGERDVSGKLPGSAAPLWCMSATEQLRTGLRREILCLVNPKPTQRRLRWRISSGKKARVPIMIGSLGALFNVSPHMASVSNALQPVLDTNCHIFPDAGCNVGTNLQKQASTEWREQNNLWGRFSDTWWPSVWGPNVEKGSTLTTWTSGYSLCLQLISNRGKRWNRKIYSVSDTIWVYWPFLSLHTYLITLISRYFADWDLFKNNLCSITDWTVKIKFLAKCKEISSLENIQWFLTTMNSV